MLFCYKIKPKIPLYFSIKSPHFQSPLSNLLAVAALRYGRLQSIQQSIPSSSGCSLCSCHKVLYTQLTSQQQQQQTTTTTRIKVLCVQSFDSVERKTEKTPDQAEQLQSKVISRVASPTTLTSEKNENIMPNNISENDGT